MAERKATNKYYPPDWDPSKGSVNRHKKSHPLRDRARKVDQGILIVRFEMPFNIWCLKCDKHIGMGVRYNAEKAKVGNYYTSPIYKFRMKCHLCDNHFEIQTDPSKFDYVILSGARKQIREPAAETSNTLEQTAVDDEESKRKMATDAMSRLERKIEDKIQGEAQLPDLQDLKQSRSRWEDSFAANQLIRSQFRQRRKKIEQTKEKDRKLLKNMCLQIPLVKSSQIDKAMAKDLLKQSRSSKLIESDLSKRRELLSSKIVICTSQSKKISRSPEPGSSSSTSVNKASNSLMVRIKRDPG